MLPLLCSLLMGFLCGPPTDDNARSTSQPTCDTRFGFGWWMESPYKELQDALNKAADAFEIDDVLEIEAHLEGGGLIHWKVNFEVDPAWNHLERIGFENEAEPRRRWFMWYERINADLLATTESIMARSKQIAADPLEYRRINLQTDVSTEIYASRSQVASFRGSRPVYLNNPPEGLDKRPRAKKSHVVEGVRLSVELVPERTTWQRRDSISGVYRLKNAGAKRITIRPWDLPEPHLLDSDKNPPSRFAPKMSICGTPLANAPPIILEPSQTHECWFYIDTDPLEDAGGVIVKQGRYTLHFTDLIHRLNIPTECDPVPIVIESGDDSLRIVRWFAGGKRLVVVREDGLVEAFDIDRLTQVAESRIRDYIPVPRYETGPVFAPDGSAFAIARQDSNWRQRKTEIILFELDGTGSKLQASVDDSSLHGMRLLRFNETGDRLFAGSEQQVVEIERSSGRVAQITKTGFFTSISPDAKYLVSWADSKPKSIRSRLSPDQVTNLNWSNADQIWSWSPGRFGIFVKRRQEARIALYDYRGHLHSEFETSAHKIVCESASGSHVVFSIETEVFGYAPNQLEVWDVQGTKKLATLPNDANRNAYFVEDPLRVVCAKTKTGPNSVLGPAWYSSEFEIFDAKSGRLIKKFTLPAP